MVILRSQWRAKARRLGRQGGKSNVQRECRYEALVGGQRSNLGSQVDVARVEVLRGPQGGFYGRSSVGGTVDMIYATPEREFSGYAKASHGAYNRTEGQSAVNVPVGENYEVGLKGERFDGVLSANIAAFLLRQEDLLLAQTTSLGGVDRT